MECFDRDARLQSMAIAGPTNGMCSIVLAEAKELGFAAPPHSRVAFGMFEVFYKAEVDNQVRLATLILGSHSQAEEVVQDVFIKLHKRWDKVDNPGGFVHRAVVNACYDKLRRRKVAEKYLRKAKQEFRLERDDNTSEPAVNRLYLHELVDGLSPRRRTILILKYYAGFTQVEISEILGISLGTTQSNLKRGLDEIRRKIK